MDASPPNPFAAPASKAAPDSVPTIDVMGAWTNGIEIFRASTVEMIASMVVAVLPALGGFGLFLALVVGGASSLIGEGEFQLMAAPAFIGAAIVGLALAVYMFAITAGLARFDLAAAHRGSADLNDLWAGITDSPRFMLRLLGLTLMSVLISLPGQALDLVGGLLQVVAEDEPGLLAASLLVRLAGYALNLIWTVTVSARFQLAQLYIIDQDQGVISALQGSWNATSESKLAVVLAMIVSLMANFLGFIACCVGVLATLPLARLVQVIIYRQLEPGRPS
jgi:hypothetical protein